MRRRRKKRASELTPLVDVLFILLFAALIQARGVASSERQKTDTPPAADLADAGAVQDAGSSPDSDATPTDALATDAEIADATSSDATGKQPDSASYQARSARAAQTMASAIGNKPVAIVEIAITGHLAAITMWQQGQEEQRHALRYPLLREIPTEESDFELEYRGDRNPRHQLCAIVGDHIIGAAPNVGAEPTDAGHDGPDDAGADTEAGRVLGEMVVLVTTDAPYSDLPWSLRRGLEQDSERCFNGFRGLAILVEPPKLAPQ